MGKVLSKVTQHTVSCQCKKTYACFNLNEKWERQVFTMAYDVNGLEQYDGMLDNGVRMNFFFLILSHPPIPL